MSARKWALERASDTFFWLGDRLACSWTLDHLPGGWWTSQRMYDVAWWLDETAGVL